MPQAVQDAGGGPYRVARTVAGLFLLGVSGIVYVTDPARDTGQMLLMLGTGGVLLGVDIVKRFVR